MGLTLKQSRFVQAYLGVANGNGREAAEIAGYKGTPETLSSTAYDVLSSPQVKSAMQTILTPEEVQQELSKVATLPSTLLGALPSKVRSLELLGKIHGLLSEKVTIGLDREAVEQALAARIAELSGRPQLAESIDVEPQSRRD